MRRHIALLLGVAFVVLGVVGFPMVYYLWLLQQPTVVERALEPDFLYALAVPGVIIELEKEKSIRALDGTVLELDRTDLNFLLQTSFGPADIRTKALEVHRSIVDRAKVGPRDTFNFAVSVKEEFPIVQQHLLRVFRRKMVAQEECSMGQFLGIAWRSVGKLFGVRPPSPEEQLRRLPRCRPPRMVQNGVMQAVEARLHRARAHAPDSLQVRPAFGPKAHRFVRRSLETGQAGPDFILIFPGLLVLIVLLSWKQWTAMWARLGAPLMITGLLLLMASLPLLYFSRDLDLFTTIHKVDPEFRMSESTGQWLQVVFYLLREVMRVAARDVALLAGFLLLAGLVCIRQHQRSRLRSQQRQIDTASGGELGSAPISASPTALHQDDAHAASRSLL